MRVLVTGASGAIGSRLVPHLERAGHELRALARDPARVHADIPVVTGDLVTGIGLEEALDGIEAAYYLVHSMESSQDGTFEAREVVAAQRFADAAYAAGVERIVYLGGLVPADAPPSRHLSSRLEVERLLREAAPWTTALRASIVIGAESRSFRFLVRLVERLRVVPLPAWRDHRTQPIDIRDTVAFLVRSIEEPAAAGRSLDIAGPDILTYGEMIRRIADLMLVGRSTLSLSLSATPIASRVAAAIAGEDPELIGPLMEGLGTDLLPRDMEAGPLLGVRLHSFEAAVERALRDWETREPLGAR
jgi:uncharacterized protein YbjT (DUF2867 family)